MTPLAPIPAETVDRVLASTDLVALVARRVRLRVMGRSARGACPFHQVDGKSSDAFSVSTDKGFYHCFGCGAHGDAIAWLKEVEGLGFRDAVAALGGDVPLPDGRRAVEVAQRAATAAGRDEVQFVSSMTAARWIWTSASPAGGEIVEHWLEARGLDPAASFDGVHPATSGLRYHPDCPTGLWRVHEDPRDHWCRRPAMVAPIVDAEGQRWGVHVTYLTPDGRAKAALPRMKDGRARPTRKMFGSVGGRAVWLTAVFDASTEASRPLTGDADPGLPLVVGEGIETTWSVAQSLGRPCRVAAVLSLENLQGGAERLRGGAWPLWNLTADPARPPFVLAGQREVIVAVDADMKPIRLTVQDAPGAMPAERVVSGAERARICASLALQHWRGAGARDVKTVRPRMGLDFNDAMRGAAA